MPLIRPFRRARHAVLAVAVSSCLLTACGGDGDDGEGAPDGGAIPGANPGANPGSGTGAGEALGPLPTPPLTPAPAADDEPVADAQAFHTITAFPLVREPAPRIRAEVIADLDETDFARGLPPIRITVPPGVDTAENGAPFFDGLDNLRVSAGDSVALRFVPRDPDGELPGMFPQELPQGATFDDNLDGTKSLNWVPLQADIGVTAFTVVAIDPAVPAYRASQTVLIAVDPPIDPGTVPNVAPGIAPLDDYTVRVGDPVAIELVGLDRNGTEPTLELFDAPAGATLTPDPRDPDLQMLRVVPERAGPLSIEVLVRDALDSSLTTVETIELDVRARAAFALSGERLGDLAMARGVTFGSALSPIFYRQADGGVYESIAADEFAVVTPESSMKWDAINPLPGRYRFADLDNLMRFAAEHGMQVRGHPLVWYRSLPAWVEATDAADREGHMREFITRVMTRYADAVDLWDVVNEPVDASGALRDSLWLDAMGERYIDVAFRQARALDPDATLVLNEFDIGFDGPKFDGLLALVDGLQSREVPLDAVGFQMHLFSSYDEVDEFVANMAAVAERDLDVHITELDVALAGSDDEDTQAAVYAQVIDACLAQPRCTVVQSWGFTDRYSFRRLFEPLYFDRDYQPKPAYEALQEAFSGD